VSRVVLFHPKHGADLYLSEVKRHEDGSIKSGYVMNGAWNFERRLDGQVLAKDGRFIVTRWADPAYTEFPVPADWRGDYNSIMARAEEARHA
jgi:hypothetical protein